MLRRRTAMLGFRADGGERLIRAAIEARLEAIEDDDLVPGCEDDLLWCRVERSGLVLVGVGARAYIVARVVGGDGRAQRLLVR